MDPESIPSDAPGEAILEDGVWTYDPEPLPPEIQPDHNLLKNHSEAMFAIGKLNNLESWFDNPEIIISPMIHREAADSSDIETITRVTLTDIYRQEAGDEIGDTEKERKDFAEAANYVKAIRSGIERIEDGEDINVELLRDLHGILLTDVRGEEKDPGNLRDILVGVDERGTRLEEARFVPMSPARIPYALENLITFVRSGPQYAPLIDIALIHYQFETIHPFRDGNGRLGRLLIMLILYKWDLLPGPYLYPSAYFKTNKETYYQMLLDVNREGKWKEWVEFFLDAIETQAINAYSVAEKLNNLREKYQQEYVDRGPVIKELTEFIVGQPYFSEPQAVESLGRSQPAVNAAINQLWDDGVLQEITEKERNRRYRAWEVMEIIEPYS